MAQTFSTDFEAGTVGQAFTPATSGFTTVVPEFPTCITSPLSGGGKAAQADGAVGSGYFEQSLSASATRRIYTWDFTVDAGTHTAGNAVIAEVNAGGGATPPIRAQATYQATGVLGIRNGVTIATSGAVALTAGTVYRAVWDLNGATQTLTVTNAATGATVDTLTGAMDGTGFDRFRLGWVSKPNGTAKLSMDRVRGDDGVGAAPRLVASAGANQTIAAGDTFTLTGSATGGTTPYTYSWAPVTSGAPALSGSGASRTGAASSPASQTAYTYRVTVSDAGGMTATATTVVTVQAAVVRTPPADAVARRTSDSTARLTWRAGSSTAAGAVTTEVRRGVEGGSLTPLVTLDGAPSSFEDSGLTPGTSYSYDLRLYDSTGAGSARSNVATTGLYAPDDSGGSAHSRPPAPDGWDEYRLVTRS